MEKLTSQQVLDAGLDDWRKLAQGLHARFNTGDFASGTAFVAVVADAAQQAGHYPGVRLTAAWVEMTLTTHDDGWWVTQRDIDLARRISDLATTQGLAADPAAVAQFELGLDTATPGPQGRFWAALLTGSEGNVVHGDVMDPDFRVPNLWFQDTDPHEVPRQRFHIDLWLPQEVSEQRVAAAIAAGGRLVDDRGGPTFVVLADPEGNRVCVCTAFGR